MSGRDLCRVGGGKIGGVGAMPLLFAVRLIVAFRLRCCLRFLSPGPDLRCLVELAVCRVLSKKQIFNSIGQCESWSFTCNPKSAFSRFVHCAL